MRQLRLDSNGSLDRDNAQQLMDNKRPRPQEHANKKPPPGFYVDFPDILRIDENDLMQPDPLLSFKEWPRCMQLGLIASLLPLMRSESDPEARTMILQYREVNRISLLSVRAILI